MNVFPGNTVQNYKTKLAKSINLLNPSEWEVGLSEAQIPRTWPNVNEQGVYFSFDFDTVSYAYAIPSGWYSNPKPLVDQLQKAVCKDKYVEFDYRPDFNKIDLKFLKPGTLKLSTQLALLLGYEISSKNDIFVLHGTAEVSSFTTIPDINAGFFNVYVYSDVIQQQPVGDSHVSLLRALPIKGKHGEMMHFSFKQVHYYPVSKSFYETLEIDLRTDSGDIIHFHRGRVLIQLHFRKRSEM
jgi:hypothetical protein